MMLSMFMGQLVIDYNMDNNPLYEMRIMANERHSHKAVTPDRPHVYEHVDTQ